MTIRRPGVRPIATALVLGGLTGCRAPAYFDGVERLVLDAAATADQDAGHPVVGTFVQSETWLDFRPPTDEELLELRPEGATLDAYVPWIERDDLDISVQWTLRNESDRVLPRVFVTLDGANEFFDYNPLADYGLAGGADAQEPVFPTLLGFTPFELEPGEVRRGEFPEYDVTEAMYDLDVMSRYCGGPFALLYNRHEDEAVGTEMLPDDATLAGLVMLRISVGATGPVSLEYAIRVRDHDSILFDARRDDLRFEPMPDPFTPALGLGGGAGMMGSGEPMPPDPDAMPTGCSVGGDPP